jgi:site-specific DNA recombinase
MTSHGTNSDSSQPTAGVRAPSAVLYLRVSTVKQATTGGEVEGYSIPAQREACRRKAEELGARVVDEYVDAGASARSADRPALQELLARLRDQHDVNYVICHKIDRLARNRADDVAIGLTIHKAGAVLVSASEQIDDTPTGSLLHGVIAAMAEFYSKNLSHEAKKGLHEKARRGGTPGYAPLGYLNARKLVEGREIKTIILDPDRAHHVKWAFETYAAGEWSITDLVDELARRGMKTRPTATRPAVPLVRAQVHRMLSSPYYLGKLVYVGIEYDGRHPALIDQATWNRVQDMLSGRKVAGDRSWRHDHYLKGSLFCGRCGERLGVSHSRGRSGAIYSYFYCLGRNKKRTPCDLPFLPLEPTEEHVIRHWQSVRLDPDLIAATRAAVTEEMREKRASDVKLLLNQQRRLQRLERQRQKLIDAYLADALPISDLKKRQAAVAAEQRDAERLIELASINHELLEERLEIALGLLEHCERLYIGGSDKDKRALNQAFFAALEVDKHAVTRAILNPPFAELTDRSIGLADEDDDEPEPDGDGPATPPGRATGAYLAYQRNKRQTNPSRKPRRTVAASGGPERKNPEASQSRGSNVTLMAEKEGFEPSRQGFPHLTP